MKHIHICDHVNASVESFEISLPRHGVLLFAYALVTKLESRLGIFGVVAFTHDSDHSCALELCLEQPQCSVMVLRCLQERSFSTMVVFFA